MKLGFELPADEAIKGSFKQICQKLGIETCSGPMLQPVIYEMTDGMRTSTAQAGGDAYFDGGMFCLRFIHILRVLGMPACYINVIEEKHKKRENYTDIFLGLRKLYPVYREFADEYKVKLRFLGDMGESLEPSGLNGNFAAELQQLEQRTQSNKAFTAMFLINYSLDWAIKNPQIFGELPDIDVTVRHTKFQFPTGMMLPPVRSDYSSLIYVQQGSAGSTWSDRQLLTLVALSAKSKVLNSGTQYLRKYGDGEKEQVRKAREENMYCVEKKLFAEKTSAATIGAAYPPKMKRAILAGTAGPEIYEF